MKNIFIGTSKRKVENLIPESVPLFGVTEVPVSILVKTVIFDQIVSVLNLSHGASRSSSKVQKSEFSLSSAKKR